MIVVSGPSGVGKGTLLREVFRKSELPLELSVSATTRKPRPGEIHGVNYYFLTHENFQTKKNNGEFIECFEVFQSGDWYGTLKEEVDSKLSNGRWVVLEIDVQGGLAVKECYPDAMMIFVLPKSPDVLKQRLKGRATESEEAIERRCLRAMKELEHQTDYDYHIVNDHLETATNEFCKLLTTFL